MEGWIKIHYKFLNWEWANDPKMVALFIHLLLKANYQGRNWKGQDIKRGQLIIGLHSLSASTGISLQSLRTCLKRLKSTNEITIKSTNKYSLITIRNYDIYQYELTSKSTSKLTNNQQTTNKQLTTPKESNKERKKEKQDSNPLNDKEKFGRFLKLFNDIAKKNYRGCSKSKRLFKDRIKDGYKYEDFEKAIINLYADDYHKENSFKWATPEFILRSEKIEMYLNKQHKSNKYNIV